jgi:phosphoglycolate phosphatase
MQHLRPTPTTTTSSAASRQIMAPTAALAAANAANAANTTPRSSPGVVLVSFDVDGTLLRSCNTPHSRANALHKQAFSYAWRRCLDLEADIDDIKHDGGTDALILLKMAEHRGVDSEEARAALPAMQQAMLEFYFEEEAEAETEEKEGQGRPRARPGEGLELLPGARETLEALAALEEKEAATRGVATCLVTGNLEPIGWAKMRALGVEHLFTGPPRFGGFGSDHCGGDTREMWRDRSEFVRVARRRAEEQIGGRVVAAHWHVGDTPADIRAAVEAGAGALAVATGAFTGEQLKQAADEALAAVRAEAAGGGGAAAAPLPRVVVLEQGLQDVSEVLAAMGL